MDMNDSLGNKNKKNVDMKAKQIALSLYPHYILHVDDMTHEEKIELIRQHSNSTNQLLFLGIPYHVGSIIYLGVCGILLVGVLSPNPRNFLNHFKSIV